MKVENLNLPGFTGTELVVREGAAIKAVEPRQITITGTIEAPFKYLNKKLSGLVLLLCTLFVNRDAGTITLETDVELPTFGTIKGVLEFHPDFQKWDINTGEQITPHELAEKIKMNRSCFKSKEVAMNLVKDLRNFKAKVDKELEAFKDDRANYNIKKSQTVDTNIPAAFQLVVPIYKGRPKETIQVEININADNLMCSLISPEANDFISDFKDKIIDEQLKLIEEIAPDLAVIEQ